jgi:endonuclease YncB( thermonuclease family)
MGDVTPFRALILGSVFFIPYLALADFTGEVVRVIDGDRIDVLHDGRPERIRLAGINAPKRGQPFGNEAKQVTSALAFHKGVTVQVRGRDSYGRILGQVVLPDGTILNHELVRQGLAWQYRQSSQDGMLAAMEAAARQSKLGLWADPRPIPPWEWRQMRPPVQSELRSDKTTR